MFKWLIRLFIQTFVRSATGFLEWLDNEDKRGKVAADEAVKKAEESTLVNVRETANAQAEIDATDRGTSADVGKRLRDRLGIAQAGYHFKPGHDGD